MAQEINFNEKDLQTLEVAIDVPDIEKRMRENMQTAVDSGIGLVKRFVRDRKGQISDEQIVKALLDDFDNDGPIFKGIKSSIKNQAVKGLVDTENKTRNMIYNNIDKNGTSLYAWVARLKHTCPDCLALHGQIMTLQEWDDTGGRPNVRNTVCTIHGACHCALVPYSADKIEVFKNLREPIKLQKKHIKEYQQITGRKLKRTTQKQYLGNIKSDDNIVANKLKNKKNHKK